MDTGFKVKEEKKEKEVKKPPAKIRVIELLDEENVELKLLDLSDVEDAVRVLRKCAFDVTETEVSGILRYGMSFGAYVNRMLIGVGLGWPAHFDYKTRSITDSGRSDVNAIYQEEPAVLLAYEGRGIRGMLLKEREENARRAGLEYSVAYLSEDLPKGSIVDMIKEAGSQLEKLYLREGYEFFKTDRGVLAVKKL